MKKRDFAYYQEIADYVKTKIDFVPDIAIILGTALGGLADEIENPIVIPYQDIPNFLVSTVDSHAGKLILGQLCGKNVICMSGRFHYYEGYDFNELTVSVRLFKLLGVSKLILTNAAGAINTGYKPGDIMIIKDHINLIGASPTRGENISEFGPRFFDMSRVYDKELITIAKKCSSDIELRIQEGVYCFYCGPQFETPAEIRFMRIIGADAVGMSTVPEVITASHCGIKVLGLSLMTNMASGVLDVPIDGKEVDEVGQKSTKEFRKYIRNIIKSL